MPDSPYMTPGSAVADTLQAILQRQRDERRQVMLDRLNVENVQSEMTARSANTDLQRQQEERAKAMDLFNTLSKRLEDVPDEANPSNLDPEIYGEARKRGRIQATPAVSPKVSTSTMLAPPEGLDAQGLDEWAKSVENKQETSPAGSQIPAGERFIGSRDFEKEKREEGDMDAALASIAADKDANPDMLRAAMLTRGHLAQGVPAAAMQGRPSVTPISPTGVPQAPIQLPFNGQGMEMNWAPTPPSAYITPQQIVKPNPEQGNKPWMYWLKPGDSGDKAIPIGPFTAGESGKTPTVSQSQLPALAPAQMWAAYNNSFRRVTGESEENWLNRRRQARSSLASNVSARATTPEVRQFIGDAIVRINQLEAAGQQPPSLDNVIQNAHARIPDLDYNEESALRIFMTGILNGGAPQ